MTYRKEGAPESVAPFGVCHEIWYILSVDEYFQYVGHCCLHLCIVIDKHYSSYIDYVAHIKANKSNQVKNCRDYGKFSAIHDESHIFVAHSPAVLTC